MNDYNNVNIDTIRWAHKPFDVVTNSSGDVGFVQEVNVNDCQPDREHQISYAVNWLVGDENKHAWFRHEELTVHCNLFVVIAESSCHSMSGSSESVKVLMSNAEYKTNE